MPNKLSHFWQELKRRNVVRVITVYAGAAFVIIELINNITEPLRLPEWTPTLVIVLLALGFPVVIIFSWLYDVHPEGGMVKTETADKLKVEELHKSSNSWKIASYISFVVIVGLIVLNVIPRSGKKEVLEKSIAVLPFHNDSPEQTEMYFIDGTMESILDNLCKIKDLRVVSRTSVEQYRNNPKPIPTVGEEMNVSYVIEGSGLRHGDNIRLTIQLIDAVHDQHIWSHAYNRKAEEIFELQSEIAQLVAEEIEVVITPHEKNRIEKIPTNDLNAYDYYQRARQEHINYRLDRSNKSALEKTKDYTRKALELDSTYALAYAELAWVYFNKRYWDTYFSDNFLDSVLILVNIALSYDDQLAEAYVMRGNYYRETSQFDKSLEDYNKAEEFNPNNWEAYSYRGWLYLSDFGECDKALKDFYKALSLHRGSGLPMLLHSIFSAYMNAGFPDKARYYLEEKFKLDGDEESYLVDLGDLAMASEDFEDAHSILTEAYSLDSTNSEIPRLLGWTYLFLKDYKQSLVYLLKYEKAISQEEALALISTHRIAYAYWKNGFIQLAEDYFNKQMEYCLNTIKMERNLEGSSIMYYDIAGVYAFQGDNENAIKNLKLFNRRERMDIWMSNLIQSDPLFDSIRDEPEFQQIVRDVEAKYQAEHERVRQWLEENEML